jgi:hypothetical protein
MAREADQRGDLLDGVLHSIITIPTAEREGEPVVAFTKGVR